MVGYVIGKQLAVRFLAASGVSIINERGLEMNIELDNGWELGIETKLGGIHGLKSPPTIHGYRVFYSISRVTSIKNGVIKFIAWDGDGKEIAILLGCDHVKVIKDGDSARCLYCGTYMGWWCPESPTNLCDYFHTTTVIEYGREISDERYDSDDCIYCHQPEERK